MRGLSAMTVDDILTDPTSFAPVLLIGRAAIQFRKQYQGPSVMVHNIEEVRDLISRYAKVRSLDHALVVDDLAYLPSLATQLLLKLVEDSRFPIVLLSTYDRVSPVLLSRIKTVIKQLEPVTSSMSPVKVVLSQLKSVSEDQAVQDMHEMDVLKMIVSVSPLLYYYKSKIKTIRNRDRIYTILE